jgi:hypothetical protein
MKNKKRIMYILGAIILIIVIVAASLISQTRQTVDTDETLQPLEFETVDPVTKEGAQVIDETDQPLEFETVDPINKEGAQVFDETLQPLEFEAVDPVTKEGAQVFLEDISYNEKLVQVRMCVDLPTTAMWNPVASITIDNAKIPNTNVLYEDYKNPDIRNQLHRCFLFDFPNTTATIPPKIDSVTVDKLWREVGDGRLDDTALAEIKSRVELVSKGIDFEYNVESDGHGGGADISLIQIPDGMTEDEALEIIYDASFETLYGNWHFDITTK